MANFLTETTVVNVWWKSNDFETVFLKSRQTETSLKYFIQNSEKQRLVW